MGRLRVFDNAFNLPIFRSSLFLENKLSKLCVTVQLHIYS